LEGVVGHRVLQVTYYSKIRLAHVIHAMKILSVTPRLATCVLQGNVYVCEFGRTISNCVICNSKVHKPIRYASSGGVISPTQRPLRDNTQHSQETDIPAPGGVRTHNPSKREAANPRLRPRGHEDHI